MLCKNINIYDSLNFNKRAFLKLYLLTFLIEKFSDHNLDYLISYHNIIWIIIENYLIGLIYIAR